MSTITGQDAGASSARVKRFAVFTTIGVVLALSVAELVNLLGRHTIGPEWYALLIAGLSVTAGILSLALVLSPRPNRIALAIVMVLWALVALGGIVGTYYHAVGVAPEYGPVDPRPRPALAPLIFTVFGALGGAAVLIGQRLASARGER